MQDEADLDSLDSLHKEFHKGYQTNKVKQNFMKCYEKGVKVHSTPDDHRFIVDVEEKTGLMNRLEALGGGCAGKAGGGG
ncbi:hypothetical protein CYMTET_50422 [Cymbomonas tetramitiformis]|uniref:Uncharacterized protein n=1 Tax=Cymbomonas tetramitiformis TaxID=36881 RepID=A0AAE0ET56_9CHLO|nr:hypothetical protein CYMTET_50422 [Cymbomonas tetramitiformis]